MPLLAHSTLRRYGHRTRQPLVLVLSRSYGESACLLFYDGFTLDPGWYVVDRSLMPIVTSLLCASSAAPTNYVALDDQFETARRAAIALTDQYLDSTPDDADRDEFWKRAMLQTERARLLLDEWLRSGLLESGHAQIP